MAGAPLLDPDAHETVKRLGRPALAWEVLRRNPSYQASFKHWLLNNSEQSEIAHPGFAALWGLHFP